MSEKKLSDEPIQEENVVEKRNHSMTEATLPRQATGINIVENPLTVSSN